MLSLEAGVNGLLRRLLIPGLRVRTGKNLQQFGRLRGWRNATNLARWLFISRMAESRKSTVTGAIQRGIEADGIR
jgi:hypothetical protein